MNSPDPVIAEPAQPMSKRRKILTTLIVIFVVIGLLYFLLFHYVLAQRERTNDAYVAGNQISISSRVAGTVIEVMAENTGLVQAGQVLVRLDPTDTQTALGREEAALAQAVRQVRQQAAQAGQYDATITTRQLELQRALTDLARREPLLAEQAIAGEELRHAREAVELARAALLQSQRQAAAAHALVDDTPVDSNPAVLEARARYRDAWIAAQRNAIVSPITGYIAQRSVQLGQRIAAGQALMTVIALDDLWIDANFKESQIGHLRIGQPVEVVSDLYGKDAIYRGTVVGLAAGTGGAFSLLPAQNASGNWIKVVQRVPVRVSLDPKDLREHPLRIGLSTTVTVDTHLRDGAVLPAVSAASARPATQVYATDLAQADAGADAIIARNRGVAP